MASANVNFNETLNGMLTKKERDKKDERPRLQKLFDDYDLYVFNEQEAREKLIEKSKEVEKCKNFDEVDNIEDEINDIRDEVIANVDSQNETIRGILNEMRNVLSGWKY